MQIKYTQIEIPTDDSPVTVTALVITGVGITDFYKHADKIWNFIYTHNHHVLRPFHRECKKASIYSYHINEENYDPTQFPTVIFKSSWEDHKPYIEILQRELGLVIEDLPQLKGTIVSKDGIKPNQEILLNVNEISFFMPHVGDNRRQMFKSHIDDRERQAKAGHPAQEILGSEEVRKENK